MARKKKKKKKKMKLSFQCQPAQQGGETAPVVSSYHRTRPATPHLPDGVPHSPKITNLAESTFEEYKGYNLKDTQQHKLIGYIRDELPLIMVHEVDTQLLDSLAKQLRLCVFATAQMMHVDPIAVKRMLDAEFRKAYGLEVERSNPMQEGQHKSMASMDPDNNFATQFDAAAEKSQHAIKTSRKL